MTPTAKITLKLLLLAAVLLLLLSSTYVYFTSRPQQTLLEEATQRSLELSTQRFQARLGFAASDLKVVSNFLSLKKYLDHGDARSMEQQFAAFIEDKPFYHQIRYIDENGQERVRADLVEGHGSTIKGKDLELKAARHFFQAAMALPPGVISLSRLDLKVSHGKIEDPPHPVLRFSTRVQDSAGKPRGIVVITYDANILLELAQAPVSESAIYVTNQDGFFLKGRNEDEFTFMFPERAQVKFAQRFPDVWARVSADSEGSVAAKDGLFYFSTLNAREEFGSELAFQRHRMVDVEKWKLIIHIPGAYFAAQRRRSFEWLFYFNAIGLLLLTPLLFYFARLQAGRAESQRQIEKMKDEFVSVLSHELRTPLTSIRGALGLLNTEAVRNDPLKSRRMAELALSNSERLVHLINNILDMERFRSGRVELDLKPCNSRQMLVQTCEAMRGMAEKQKVVLHVQGEGHEIAADQFRFTQVLTNILGNAIKYSPEASVVELWSERRDGEVVFAIKDQGRGIPAHMKEAIFGRFQQVDTSDSRSMGGSGLGLAISKSIVQQHKGRIWVESAPEQGSIFYVALPGS